MDVRNIYALAVILFLTISINVQAQNNSNHSQFISKYDAQRCLRDLKNTDDCFALGICVGKQSEERRGYFSVLIGDEIPEAGSLGFTSWNNKVRLIEVEPPEEFFQTATEEQDPSDPLITCSQFLKTNFPEEDHQWDLLCENYETDENGREFQVYIFQSTKFKLAFQLKIWTKINRIVFVKQLSLEPEQSDQTERVKSILICQS